MEKGRNFGLRHSELIDNIVFLQISSPKMVDYFKNPPSS
jgi:hypothetical protein